MSKRALTLLIIPIALLLILNSAFIFATSTTNNSNQETQKSSLTLVKSNYENEDFEDISDNDIQITGTQLERASRVALAYIGEGIVTDTEIGDEEGYYEIEVTLNNRNQVDVHLDKNFNVLSTEWEDDNDDEDDD